MKRNGLFAGAVVVLALAWVAPVEAQLRFGFGAGPAFPVGELEAEGTTGVHVQGSLRLDVPLTPLGFRGDALWQQYPDTEGGTFTGFGGLLNATLDLSVPLVRPYLIGGAGVMTHEAPDADHGDHTHAGAGGSAFAFNVGAGVRLQLLGLGASIEARYLDWGDGNRALPLTLGFSL